CLALAPTVYPTQGNAGVDVVTRSEHVGYFDPSLILGAQHPHQVLTLLLLAAQPGHDVPLQRSSGIRADCHNASLQGNATRLYHCYGTRPKVPGVTRNFQPQMPMSGGRSSRCVLARFSARHQDGRLYSRTDVAPRVFHDGRPCSTSYPVRLDWQEV